jgi:hypothetical protein
VTPKHEPFDCDWYRTPEAGYLSDSEKTWHVEECRIREEWRAFVTVRQVCSVDTDCVLVRSGCPFVCDDVPVAAAHALDVEELQRELWERLGGHCKFKCAGEPITRAVCERGWCVGAFVEEDLHPFRQHAR